LPAAWYILLLWQCSGMALPDKETGAGDLRMVIMLLSLLSGCHCCRVVIVVIVVGLSGCHCFKFLILHSKNVNN